MSELPTGTLTRWNRILERITYKPEWEFRVYLSVVPVLEVRNLVLDADRRRPPVWATATRVLGVEAQDRDVFLRILHDVIAELDAHERIEWLRFDDVPVWPPHPTNEHGDRVAMFGPHGTPTVPEDL